MAGISLQAVKGTRDFYPEDKRLHAWLCAHWRAVAASFGFEEYDACVLEHEELYTRKAGDEIVGQLYNFEDKGGRRVALRPELTPSLARMVMARQNSLSLPLRWFAIPQCFRYERMQRGRKREHFQWNMDIVGLDQVAGEVELMSAQAQLLERVGVRTQGASPEVLIKVSDRRVLQGFLGDLGLTGDAFAATCVIVDKRDKIGREATAELLGEAGVAADVATRVLDLLELDGLDALIAMVGEDNEGVQSLQQLLALADAAGIGPLVRIDPSIVRGLSYYTGTVWELFANVGTFSRALAGGGRYDRLIEQLGGSALPMVGFGFGDVPILEFLDEIGRLPPLDRGVDDVVYPMAVEQFITANQVARQLRADGRRVLVDYSCRRFKHVVKAAEQAGAETLYILGEKEVAQGVCKRRSLQGREETEVPLGTFGIG